MGDNARKLLIYGGAFNPPHLGHLRYFEQAVNAIKPDLAMIMPSGVSPHKKNGTVPSGRMLVDGYGVGDVGNIVLRDRRHLAQDGLIVVVATVDIDEQTIISGPDLISRGFVYVRESEELMDNVRELVRGVLCDTLDSGTTEWTQMKTNVKDALSKYLYSKTKRKPMILPVIMNV